MNDDATSWKTMLLLELGLSSLGIVAFWIHVKWRKHVAADRRRWRRWAAGIALIAFEVALLAFVGMSRLNFLCTFADLDLVYSAQLQSLIPRFVSVPVIVECESGTILIGVMGAPVVDATSEA